MTRQEIIDAINSTIVANGQKGITAESLNNILTEITNAAGDGNGGDGALKVFIPDSYMFLQMFIETGFTRDAWALAKSELTYVSSNTVDKLDAVFEEYWSANTLLYQSLVEKCTNNEGALIIVDDSKSFSTAMEFMLELFGVEVDSNISNSIIACANVVQEDGVILNMEIVPMGIDLRFSLQSDGSILFTKTKDVLYIPVDNSTLSDAQILANKQFAENYKLNNSDSEDSLIIVGYHLGCIPVKFSSNGIVESAKRASLITASATESTFTGTIFDGISLKQVVVNSSDGTTTVTTLGTLTA